MSWTKDPDAILDYAFDWTAWLAEGEAITDQVVTVPAGLTIAQAATADAGVVTVWLSGGSAGEVYAVACRVTTDAGRVDERTYYLEVRDR